MKMAGTLGAWPLWAGRDPVSPATWHIWGTSCGISRHHLPHMAQLISG